jgi:hypothetical protein
MHAAQRPVLIGIGRNKPGTSGFIGVLSMLIASVPAREADSYFDPAPAISFIALTDREAGKPDIDPNQAPPRPLAPPSELFPVVGD